MTIIHEHLELAIGAAVKMRSEMVIEVAEDGTVEIFFGPCRRSPKFSWRPEVEILRQNTRLIQAAKSIGSCVYFFECVGRVKIGVAGDVADRLKKLQTGCPYPITIIGLMSGGPLEEKGLHERFRNYRVQREWFRFSNEIQKFVAENCVV